MAKPTARVDMKTEEQVVDLDSVIKLFAERQTAFYELMDIVQLLHERGILGAIKAALLRYHDLLDAFSGWLMLQGSDSPLKIFEVANSLKAIDVDGLSKILSAASRGVERGLRDQPADLYSLVKSFNDEDIKRGLRVIIEVLRELGAHAEPNTK
jgi:uncharacterized protein YjgD (DUF1641 family)